VQVQFPAPFVDWNRRTGVNVSLDVTQLPFFVAKSVTRLFETVCIYLLVLVFAHCFK
jgi:hypothetical protein